MAILERQRLTRTSDTVASPARRDAVRSVSHAEGMAAKILGMQQTLGNQAVQERASTCPAFPSACPTGGACHTCPAQVQAKLAVSQPGDVFEQETDRVAEQVMGMLGKTGVGGPLSAVRNNNAMAHTRQTDDALPDAGVPINAIPGSGQPLPESIRSFFEPRFGYDFGGVRVHTDTTAAESARAVNARAYTLRRDIVFGAGQYAPGAGEGQRLLAHELTHVIQQRAGLAPPMIQRDTVHFYDFTDNPARRLGYAHHYCEDYSVIRGACNRDKPGMRHAGVDDIAQVPGWVSLFRAHGHTINRVSFHTHGAPGYVHLPRGGLNTTNVSVVAPIASQLAPGAVIGFLGCNVGEGAVGDAFLQAAGSAMLSVGGGSVYASDSVTFSVPGIGQRHPIWSSIKRVCVDPGGAARIC